MTNVVIIAEAGVNHNGDINIAKKMVDVAKSAGADYVKFQTFNPAKLVSKFAQKADYQKENTNEKESQLEMLRKLMLTNAEFEELSDYCKCVGIGFVSTPFDFESIDFLEKFNMDFWKISSGEITNLPYLEKIGKTKRKVIMSTGMSDIKEIKNAINILENNGAKEVVVLHCNTQYPTPFNDVNLKAMLNIKEETHKEIGYSDHTPGIEVAIAAVALGATVIEKHFTLDQNMQGPDHKASLNPSQLSQMVKAIRNIEIAMGNDKKNVTKSEQKNKDIARKSIVALKNIKIGEVLTPENITVKRPGNGISPMKWYDVIGTKAIRDFTEDELIEI